jgi:hypothetical protein
MPPLCVAVPATSCLSRSSSQNGCHISVPARLLFVTDSHCSTGSAHNCYKRISSKFIVSAETPKKYVYVNWTVTPVTVYPA